MLALVAPDLAEVEDAETLDDLRQSAAFRIAELLNVVQRYLTAPAPSAGAQLQRPRRRKPLRPRS